GGGGGMRPRFGGSGPQYTEQIRRATSGPPRGAAPSHEAGEPIAGPHAVLEAMRAGRAIRKLYISQDRSLRTGAVNDLIAEAQERRIFVNYLDKLDLSRLSPVENHQGVVAIFEGRAGVDLDELLIHLEAESGQPLVLIVDSLQDPQNFGVLLRSAEGAGVAGVVIPRHRSVGLTPAVAKTSAGASEHLLVAEVANLRQAIDTLKEKGLWVVGTDETGDLLYDEVDYRGPTALVIGGEGEGIRRLVLEGCDMVVRIPMEGRIASLNAAAAGTVVLYEALRQRRRDQAPPGTQTPRPQPAEAPLSSETDDLVDTPELEEDLATPDEPVDDLVAEDGDADVPVEAAPAAKTPRKTAAKKAVKKTTKKSDD
ncbi:MAG TPA: 23S rRNA (guanosine(2251)-2'-O)-methyltransferase RlmB, partial [Candidatus Limnocylindria bacterium]